MAADCLKMPVAQVHDLSLELPLPLPRDIGHLAYKATSLSYAAGSLIV